MKNLLRKNKRGNILTENIIFIVLNLAFITILLLFLFSRTGDASVLEEKYAKQIALLIDAAEPIMTIHLSMEDAIEIAEKENFPAGEIVKITGNVVTVKLGEDGGYSYSFFNDVDANANFDTLNKKEYYFVVNEKQ
ncbi:MAG: hypothetical protein Q8P15_02535 [Nanoarchaeota archaeon]|nr:hypothetical protein [Nanoarchaeota archaeon]